MRFDILTLFPPMFGGYLGESIIKRAITAGHLDVRVHNLRDWSADPKHHKVDDRPFGGGPGMVMMVEPFYRALKALRPRRTKKTRVILMSAKGKLFTHADAVRLAKYQRVILLCGHYEGVDERVVENLCDEELSIGEYVLTGGELPALVIMDAVARHVPGVLGKAESLSQESHTEEGLTEYPQYTRPEVFVPKRGTKWPVPEILLSGDHQKIATWRQTQRKKTQK
jgi:tRNA (guanine37-N1)-methyltransferase